MNETTDNQQTTKAQTIRRAMNALKGVDSDVNSIRDKCAGDYGMLVTNQDVYAVRSHWKQKMKKKAISNNSKKHVILSNTQKNIVKSSGLTNQAVKLAKQLIAFTNPVRSIELAEQLVVESGGVSNAQKLLNLLFSNQ